MELIRSRSWDHERWALLLHFPNCQLLSAGTWRGREAESMWGSLSPCLPDWDSLTRAQQAPALPWAACVMLSYSNPSVLRFLCGELRLMSLPFSCALSALSSWIAGSCVVLWHCLASPLIPEQQPAKHHRACSSRAGWPGHCREQQCTAGLKFSPHVANANLVFYARIFPEVRPLAFCSAGPSMVASLAQHSRSSRLLRFPSPYKRWALCPCGHASGAFPAIAAPREGTCFLPCHKVSSADFHF